MKVPVLGGGVIGTTTAYYLARGLAMDRYASTARLRARQPAGLPA
ncbi:hypothetical protein VAR608DRAFT_6155 [Variovorax sp. HW608]|nr:hypothetical protein [Variovorax sp. HW608]SCK57984.1 hypothetical protein VAR608DRAFT_6155 [Variovorax sp. HW608]